MGTVVHKAIVVTSWSNQMLIDAHTEALKIFPSVSDIVDSSVNKYVSFLVPPDGSKNGWVESETGDMCRSDFIKYLESCRYDDGSTSLEWVEVSFSNDNREAKVLSHTHKETSYA